MIICKNCGAELPDNAKFCTKCGYAVDFAAFDQEPQPAEPAEAAPAYDDWNAQAAQAPQPAPQYTPYPDNTYQGSNQYPVNQPYGYQENASYDAYREQTPADDEKTSSARGMMILSIVGAALGGIAGIIICAIARGKVNAWTQKYGTPTGMAKAANIISKVGLILSIVGLVLTVIYLFIYIGLLGNLGRAYGIDWGDIFEELFDFR